ncbi:MAG TPA: SurA N-terminal domain-containing protein [Puia sp.]|nr:SurA N-terminal domain-containing protein [Puia sp.]
MSIIQSIRDKAAWLVFGLIAVSLAGFILMDAGKSKFFGGGSQQSTVGTVNGEELDYVNYEKRVQGMEQQQQTQMQGQPLNEMQQQNIRQSVWDQFVEDATMDKVYDELGLQVTDKELNDMLVGPNAIPDIRRSFTDPKTGAFDAQAAASTINQLRTLYRSNNKSAKGYEQARSFFEEGIPQIVKYRLKEKYIGMLTGSVYIPKWMGEKTLSDASQISSISYVVQPYSKISDSAVKISDDDIADYVSKHKDQYKQDQSRTISYVTFNAAPTSADSSALKQQMVNVKPEFASTTDVQGFLARNEGGDYADTYTPKSKMPGLYKDSLIALTKGGVFGPYLEAGNYMLAKKIDERSLPDSIKCRHILIKVADQQKGQIRDDTTAKKLIDSIAAAIKGGADFNQLVLKYSEDEGSKNNKGEYNFASSASLVKPFYETVFYDPVGTKKVVKAESDNYIGYHYIEVLSQKDFEPAYKMAYLAKRIIASSETEQNASGLANQFAGESRTRESFDASISKEKLQKLIAPDLTPTSAVIPGLGTSRDLLKWVYDDKTSVGDVSTPWLVGQKYVVAMLTEINKEGTMGVAKAKPIVEPILRNQKKADEIEKKIGNPASLDAVASSTGQPKMKSDSVSFSSIYIPNAGREPKVVGASFDRQLTGKPVSPGIAGGQGVFYIQVLGVSAKSGGSDLEQIRFSQAQQQKSMIQYRAIEVLKKTSAIKDNRSSFI